MNTFEEAMKKVGILNVTENGALSYETTMKPLVDCNFRVADYRRFISNPDIYNSDFFISDIKKSFKSDELMTFLWLFFLRDCRGGLGERQLFRNAMIWLSDTNPAMVLSIMDKIPSYGRWDDLIEITLGTNNESVVKTGVSYIKDELNMSYARMDKNLDVSLLAKWMPSINTSSKETVKKAKRLCNALGYTEKEYRVKLSSLRKYLNVTERNLSLKEYDKIEYQSVPAKAAMNYSEAFLRHDTERYGEYIKKVISGEISSKISGLDPYVILRKEVEAKEEAQKLLYESIWNNFVENGFPDAEQFGKAICVVDTSGSMTCPADDKYPNGTRVIDIAISLGLYFSQKITGPFHEKMITFSERPSWIDVSKCNTLHEKYFEVFKSDWGMNTNINAVFNLLLELAKSDRVKEEDMPDTLLIVSDMQFDDCVMGSSRIQSIMDTIADRWHDAGYKLPKLVFWSVRGGRNVPMLECGDNGLALISGYNQNAAKVGLSEKKDPEEALKEVLLSERYAPIKAAYERYEKLSSTPIKL